MRSASAALALLLAASLSARADAPDAGAPALDPTLPPVFVKDTRESPEMILFSGNVLFNEFTYRAVLQLPKNAKATPKIARLIVVQLTRFLRTAGYDLAQVQAEVDDNLIRVVIDEGRLDKVIITGESAVNSVRLRLELALAFDVFNRPELETRLRALSLRMGLTDASYQLVRTKDKPEETRILERTGALEELRDAGLLSEPGVYELHIAIRQGTWGKGFSPEIVIGGLDGIGVGGVFHGEHLLPIDDRWETRVRGGVTTVPSQDRMGLGSQIVLSRALAELHYFGPPMLGKGFRPGLLLSSDLLEQSRRDIGYDLFRRETLQAALGIGDTLGPRAFLAAGIGLQARWFFDLDDPFQTGFRLQPEIPRQVRPFFLSVLRLNLDPKELRADYRCPVSATAQVYYDAEHGDHVAYRLDAGIDYAVPIGWHELRWDAHAFAIGGPTLFFDQDSIGNYMQGVFNEIFSAHIIEAGAEFRYSLLRDMLKVGILSHVVVFGDLNPTTGQPETGELAASVGLGLHTLVWDAINIDADLSIGRRAGVTGGPAFSLNLTQVY